mgnify:FL=1|jgi:hypothetical protein
MDLSARRGVQVESEGEWRMIYAAPAGLTLDDSDGMETDESAQGEEDGIIEVVWTVSILSTWVEAGAEEVLKMEGIEIIVNDWTVSGNKGFIAEYGLPGRVLDVLEVRSKQSRAGVLLMTDHTRYGRHGWRN